MFGIPWELFGGFPEKYFKFQVYRKKNQTSEVLALNPLDLNATKSPDLILIRKALLSAYLEEHRRLSIPTVLAVILPVWNDALAAAGDIGMAIYK